MSGKCRDVAQQHSQHNGAHDGDSGAGPHDFGLVTVARFDQVGDDSADNKDCLEAFTQDDEEGGQECGQPRAAFGRTCSFVPIEGVGIFTNVVLQRGGVLVDNVSIAIVHRLFQQREFHLHCRHASAGDTRHDLLFKSESFVSLVVRHVHGVLASFNVTVLEVVHGLIEDAVHFLGDLAPRSGAV